MIHRFSDRDQDAFEERPRSTIIGILFQRRVPILIGLGILLVIAITLVLVLPRQFQSHLDILVRNKLPLSARVSATAQETVDEERMQTEVALLHSPELAARVVDPDYPTQPDATHTAADIKRHQAAVALFSQQLITTVAPNSNLIHVVVTAQDPHRAGELASRLLDVFFASQSEVAHPTPATSFFINEANRARAAWQEAQLALDGFLLAHPTTPTGNAADLTLQIAALNHQIQRNDEQIDAAIGRILTGERKLITIPAHPLDPANKSRNRSSAMPLLSAAQLNAMLAIYTDEQAILLTRPPTDSEAVRASLSLASQIADTNAAKRLADQAAPDSYANSLWQSTTEDIAQAGVELKTLYATRSGLSHQLASFQASLDAAQHPSTILAGLQTRATTLQNAFRLADQRANEARIADAMDQQLRLNVAVASRPSFSNTATSPSPWLFAAAIALAVIFLAACLTLFSGMYSSEYDHHEEQDDFYDDEEDGSSSDYHTRGFVPEVHEDLQEQIPFPSRIRSSQSGAFLYAAPGASVPPPPPLQETDAPHADPAFEPIPTPPTATSPSLSDLLSQPPEPTPQAAPLTPDFDLPESQDYASDEDPTSEDPTSEDQASEDQDPEPYPSPQAQILPPHQYTAEPATPEEPSSFESHPPHPRHASGETHAAVPSFFAAPPTSTHTQPEDDDTLPHEDVPPYTFFHERPAPDPTPEPAPPFPYAAAPAEEPAPSEASTIPAPAPEPIVTTPDPTPPWSQPTPEPVSPTPPPLSYWASVYESAPAEPLPGEASHHQQPQPPTAPEPSSPEPAAVSAAPSVPAAPPVPAAPSVPAPFPVSPEAIAPQPVTPPPVPQPVYAEPQPTTPAPQPAVVPGGEPVVAPVAAQALPQAFTSTIRPDSFLTRPTSTLSSTAFRFAPVPKSPASAPRPAPPAPAPIPAAIARPTPTEPRAFAPDPELILSYTGSEPIELVPDPVLPPIKLPYKITPPSQPAPNPEPTPIPPPEVSEFPLYRVPRPTPEAPVAPAAPPAEPATRPQTYEEMVRALVYPEETAPYVPPARPTASTPRRAEPIPEPVHPAAFDDDAPPFLYIRKSAAPPAPPAPQAPHELDEYETLQNFIRRPSVPPTPPSSPSEPTYRDRRGDDPSSYRPAFRSNPAPEPWRADPSADHGRDQRIDDRTTYSPAAAAPTPPAPPQQPRSSWIDVAPPPPPRLAKDLDPQKRQPDRISAIRDSGTSRVSGAYDESGARLTPSQRMKRARLNPTYDKDGNLIYTTDQDKTRY